MNSNSIPRPGFPKRPDGTRGAAHAKQMLLCPELMPDDVRKAIAHDHTFDIIFNLGSVRSGKSAGTVARCRQLMKTYPGIRIIVGSMNYQHLLDTIVEDWRKILSIKADWDHPDIVKRPTKNDKLIVLKNFDKQGNRLPNSKCSFVNMSDPDRILSMECDVFHAEEAQKLPRTALDQIIGRMSGSKAPVKQIIMNANPDEADLEWLRERANLDYLDPNYDGEIPPQVKLIKNKDIPCISSAAEPDEIGTMIGLGPMCLCHLCRFCRKQRKEIEYVDGICPECQSVKRSSCSGRQYYTRVILSSHLDNIDNLPEDFGDNTVGSMSADARETYGKGRVRIVRSGLKTYSYTTANMTSREREIDSAQNIIWHMDFNIRPQCSGISQVTLVDGLPHINVIDEIIELDANVVKTAKIFCERFLKPLPLDYDKRILVYGDPNGWRGGITGITLVNFLLIQRYIAKWMEREKAFGRERKFKVKIMTWDTVFKIEDRVNSVNHLLEEKRLIFNKRCIYHTLSADKTKWNKAGTKESEAEDIKAREKMKPGDLYGLTHPMAGLGYWVVQEYPLLPHAARRATGAIVANVDSDTYYDVDADRERSFDDDSFDDEDDEVNLSDSDDDDEDQPRVLMRPRLPKPKSPAQLLREQGLWNLPYLDYED